MAGLMLSNIQIKKDLLGRWKYKYLFSVEEVKTGFARQYHSGMLIKKWEWILKKENSRIQHKRKPYTRRKVSGIYAMLKYRTNGKYYSKI